MINFEIFVISVVFWFGIFTLFVKQDKNKSLNWYFSYLLLAALLCIPFSYKGNLYTVLGSGVTENSIYSLSSLYQRAGNEAVASLGFVGYQEAEVIAATGVGLAIYQKSEHTAIIGLGLSLYQTAKKESNVTAGLIIRQIVEQKQRWFSTSVLLNQ